MEKRIPFKTLYLLLVIGIGLVGLGLGSTYAIFTASAEIDNPITLSSNLSHVSGIIETIEVEVPAGETVNTTLNVINSSGITLNYVIWYLNEGYDITVRNNNGVLTTGKIDDDSNISSDVAIKNNSTSSVKVTLGVSSGSNSVVLGSGMTVVPNVTPLSDFNYLRGMTGGTGYVALSFFLNDGGSFEPDNSLIIAPGEILLVEYIGDDKNVLIPDTYVIDGVTYNVTLLSNCVGNLILDDFETQNHQIGVFLGNKNIENVIFGENVEFYASSAKTLFSGCSSLINVSDLPDTITNMYETFLGCTSLVDAPYIPSSVTDMRFTFFGCTNLTGTVRINSGDVSDAYKIFNSTSKSINVEAPFSSVTYNTLNSTSLPSNVTLNTFEE